MATAPREDYLSTLLSNDLNAQAQTIMTGMGLDPGLTAGNLPHVVGRALNLHHAAVPHNTGSTLTHIASLRAEIQRILAPNYLRQWRAAGMNQSDAHLANATVFWNHQVAVLAAAQMFPAPRAAPTFQNP